MADNVTNSISCAPELNVMTLLTYQCFVEIFADIVDQFGFVAAGEDGVEGVFLDGAEETSRMPEAHHLALAAHQALNKIIHRNVGRSTNKNLKTITH